MNQALANLPHDDDLESDRCSVVQRPIQCEVLVGEIGTNAEQLPPIVVGSPALAVLNSRCAVIGMLAVVGPVGLPFLWFSQRFSRSTKVAMTVAFLVLTVVLPLAFTYYWVETAIRPLVEAFHRVKH